MKWTHAEKRIVEGINTIGLNCLKGKWNPRIKIVNIFAEQEYA